MNAILVARVSTEEQKEAGLSLPAQIARLERYCEQKQFKIIKTFSFDESAFKKDRAQFDGIMSFVAAQKEKVAICCDKVDRLSRNAFDKRIGLLHELAEKDKIELHFVSDGAVINSTTPAAGKLNFGLHVQIAEFFSRTIGDNVKRAFEQKRRRGEILAKPPFGYKQVTNADGVKDVIVDDLMAPLIRKTFELYTTGAFSMALLAKKISEDYNVNWRLSFVDKVLRNPFYCGINKFKNGTMYPHKYPPLITKEMYDRAQTTKAGHNKKPVKYRGLPFAYRGLIRCAKCDCTITPEGHKGRAYYHCTQSNGKHNAKWFREEALTEMIGGVFKQLQLPKQVVSQIVDTVNESHRERIEFQKRQYQELVREQQTLSKMMDNLYLDKLKGSITNENYDKFYKQFNEQLMTVTTRLNQIERADETYHISVKLLMNLCSQADDFFKSSEIEQKRQIIKLIFSNLKLDDESLLYEAQKPFDLILKSTDQLRWRP